ncbi:MAG: HlyD family efflux transporter periplasmic adaptor subunit [Clostridia bacterium]
MPEQDNETTDLTKIKKRRKIRKIIYLALLGFLLLYVPAILLASNGARAELAIIGNGSISDSIKAEGLVLKEELVFTLPFDGVFTKEASEGERVPAGYKIASVVDEIYAVKFREMEELADEILSRKKNGDINSGIFTRDLKLIEDRIRDKVREMAVIVSTGSLAGIAELQEEIEAYSADRDAIISGSSTEDAYTGDLENRYNILRQSLADKMAGIYTDRPGYISYAADGLEGIFAPGTVFEYTVPELKAAIKNTGGAAQAKDLGNAFARLVTGNFYTLAFVLDEKDADKLKARGSATLTIEEMGIEFMVDDIEYGDEDDGKVCVFMKTNKKLGELASARKIKAEIVFYKYTGLMVPVKSLLNMDAYPIREVEIAKVSDNWIKFITVEVVASNGSYAIIRNPAGELNLYDSYAVRPKKVEEGQVVK